jgi:hypothetical protein
MTYEPLTQKKARSKRRMWKGFFTFIPLPLLLVIIDKTVILISMGG